MNNEYHLGNLIDAIGDRFRNLILHTQYTKKLKQPWECVPNKKLYPNLKSSKGETAGDALFNFLIKNENK